MYGKTQEQLQAVEVAELATAAAMLRMRKGVEDFNPVQQELNAGLEREAQALERQADAKASLASRQKSDREDPMRGAMRAVDDYMEHVKGAGDATAQAVGQAIGGLEDALTTFVSKGKADFSKLFDSIIADALRLKVIKPLLAEVFGGAGGGGGGSSDFGLIMQGIQAFAGFGGAGAGATGSGAAATFGGESAGAIIAGGRALGGPVDAGRTYMVGEKGPELFVPSASGQIVPNGGGSGGGVRVSYAPVINIDARSDAAAIRTQVQRSVAQGNSDLMEHLRAQGALR